MDFDQKEINWGKEFGMVPSRPIQQNHAPDLYFDRCAVVGLCLETLKVTDMLARMCSRLLTLTKKGRIPIFTGALALMHRLESLRHATAHLTMCPVFRTVCCCRPGLEINVAR